MVKSLTSERFFDTPLLYNGKLANHFIPKDYQGRVKVLEEKEWEPEFENLEDELDNVLANPVGFNESLEQLVGRYYGKNNKVLLLVDDNTRPNVHTKILLPLLIPRLIQYGINKKDLYIMFSSGTHRPPTSEEQKIILGPKIWTEYQDRLLIHDCDSECVDLGVKSSKGTPILVNPQIFTADLVIPVTDSELHYMAGVAGTIKELIPGVASRETITKNHIRSFDKKLGFKAACRLGNVEENPMISDLREIASLITKKIPVFGIDAIFSLRSEEIVYLNAGDLEKLHEEALKRVVTLRTVEIEEPADLVIISAKQLGLNLYQTVKAIHTAWYAVRRDGKGKILVLAACQDGVGSNVYLHAMEQCRDMPPDQALTYVLENYCTEETFRIGNQKLVDVFRILMSIGESNIQIITEMDPELLKYTFRIFPLKTTPDMSTDAALRQEISDHMGRGEYPSIYVIPDPGILIVQKK